ncbi:MAG: efflux RND transporter periplasmic adaptor subunit [Sphingomonadales bacterium]
MFRSGSLIVWAFVALIGGFGTYLMSIKEDPETMSRMAGGRQTAVEVRKVTTRTFTDVIEALGTAKANESVVLTARVSETIETVNFEDGIFVEKSRILVELTNTEEMAQSREAEATLREAEQQLERIKDLQNKGNASEALLDTRIRSVEEARSRLGAAQARNDDRVIRAPFAGILGLRSVSEGTLVFPGAQITTLDDIETIKLDFSVPERFLSNLSKGQGVVAKSAAFSGSEFKGIVKTINSRIDPITRAVIVRAEIKNADHRLRPGMLLTIKMIGEKRKSLSIEEKALVPVSGEQFLFKFNEDGKALRQLVTIGRRQNGFVEILSGLKAGDKVVVSGTTRLRNGSKVRVVSN